MGDRVSAGCRKCGGETETFGNGEHKKHCPPCLSRVCACGNLKGRAQRSCRECYNELQRKRAEAERRTTCDHCGESFVPKRSKYSSYCSNSCMSSAMWEENWGERRVYPSSPVSYGTCPCGTMFTHRGVAAPTYCSDACRKDVLRARQLQVAREAWEERPERPCGLCGKMFKPPFGKPNSLCSKEWSRKRRRQWKRRDKDRRRALLRGAFVEDVDRPSIYERDGWRCKICNKAVRRDAEVPHPLAPTLDHIIPLAEGGTHEPRNVQCAHFRCNSVKSASSAGSQLLLIG